MTEPRPFVSLIIPCRNEEAFIGPCLDSVVANDYPRDRLEVLVLDGASNDGTRQLALEYAAKFPHVRVLSNPVTTTPAAFNLGIREARGELVMLMGAHARFAPDYITRCINGAIAYGADNVGGVMVTVPQRPGPLADSIVQSLSHRFGVGSSWFRVHDSKPIWVDTVFGGCYRREVFDRIGLFNERLVRSQDIEFNLRLKRSGGRTLLLPDAVSYYYARSDLKSFWKHNWNNGVWAILPFQYSAVVPVSWRHLVPLAFACSLVLGAVANGVGLVSWRLVAVGLGIYAAAALAAALQIAVKQKRATFALTMPVTFAALHFAYGFGSLWGVLTLAVRGCGRIAHLRS